MKKTTDYSDVKNASLYGDGLIAARYVLEPLVFELLGPVKGKAVLDVGCGAGHYSLELARAGAKVIGIDKSEAQVKLASERSKHSRIQFQQADICKRTKFQDRQFNTIVVNLVLPSLIGATGPTLALRECSRLLAPKGRIVVSWLHPLWLVAEQDALDRADKFDFGKYFKEGHIFKGRAKLFSGRTIHFRDSHYSLEHIFACFRKANLSVVDLRESLQCPRLGIKLPKFLIARLEAADR